MVAPFATGWPRWWPLLLVALLALLLRLIYLEQIQESLFFDVPLVDARTYLEHGLYLSTQSWAGHPQPFWQPPLYPYALGLCFELFGPSLYLPRFFQALLGAGVCVLIYALGRRVFPKTVALGAAIVAAFYGPLIYFGGELLPTIPAIFLNLLLLLSLVRPPSSGLWPWLGSGLLLGLCALSVANILFFAPFVLYWLWSSNKEAGIALHRTLQQGALFVLGCALIIAPITLRNYTRGGDLVLISHNAGINFYIGNNPNYDQTVNIRPGQDWLDLVETPEREAGIGQPSAESSFFFARSWAYITGQPLDYLQLLGRKVYLFWHGDEIRRNIDPYFSRRDSGLLQILLWKNTLAFPFGLVAPLALLGLVAFWRSSQGRTPQGRMLLFFVLAYILSVVLFFVTSRYRLPAVPLLLLFAGYGLYAFWHSAHRLKIMGVLAGLVVLSNLGAGPMDELGDTQQHFWMGYAYEQKGMKANAMREYRWVIENRPDHKNALLSLANLYNANKQYGEAIGLYQQYLSFYPQAVEQGFLLGNAYLNERRYDKAIAIYTDIIPGRPQWAALRGRLGYAYLMSGQPQRAAQAYLETLELKPDSSLVRYQLARLYGEIGDSDAAEKEGRTLLKQEPANPEYHALVADLLIKRGKPKEGKTPWGQTPLLQEAESHLRQAIGLNPDFVQGYWSLGRLLVGQKRYGEAIEPFEKILHLDPGDFVVHRHLGNLYKRAGNLDKAEEHYGRYSLADREHAMGKEVRASMEKQVKKILDK